MNGETPTAIRDRLPSDTIMHCAVMVDAFTAPGIPGMVAALTVQMANQHHDTPYHLEWLMVHQAPLPMVVALVARPSCGGAEE